MDIGGRSRHNGFVEIPKDHLVEYNLERDVSCAEPSSERHIAHIHAPKVSNGSKERYWNGVNIDSHMHANSETTETVYFRHDLCRDKLIADSGDTKSVAGLRVFEEYHKTVFNISVTLKAP